MAELSEEQLRIRAYLQGQAAKLSLPALIAKVRDDSAQLREAALRAEDADWTLRPAAEEWSVNDVLGHVVDTCHRVNAGIIGAIESGTKPVGLRDALVHEKSARRPMEWWDELVAAREGLFARLAVASADEHLDVTWNHPFFGELNWREWVLFLRLHDLDHARQIAGILAAQGKA
jgi:uncharacterized damage-inducible protein DinB